MRIVIDIPEEIYNEINSHPIFQSDLPAIEKALKNGTPLPKGHGDLIDRSELMSTRIITDDYSGNEIMDVVLAEDIDYAPTIIPAERSDT